MKRKYVPTLGSISYGTLRTEDLMDAFLRELCHVAPRKHGALKREAGKALASYDTAKPCQNEPEEYADIVNDLQDVLSWHAPPFMYFGNMESDGTAFGWCPDWQAIDELPRFDDTGKAADARFVGEFRVVSDHGNVELYVRFANGRIKSLFGIV